MSKVANDWFDLPRAAQGIRLYQIRDELREKNLHDTEEPPLESSTAPAGWRRLQRAHQRRHLQRPQVPADGQRGDAVRAQRALERGVPRHRQPADAEPATGQPRAPDPHHLPARHDPQRDRRGVDPVHGPRLVRAQEGHLGRTPTTSRWTRRTAGTNGRCACRRRRRIRRRWPTRSGRRPTSTRTRTGGTARTSMAAARQPRRRSAPGATARCSSARADGSAWIR